MAITALARPEIRGLSAYQTVASREGAIKMNANEAPVAVGAGVENGLNRYPALRPVSLTRRMSAYYGVSADNILATRGSSEGIDLLFRAFCAAGHDEVLLTPPAFEMYRVYASIQGARIVNMPLQADTDFSVDTDALLGACSERTKLIFLCTPNNPVGTTIPREQILEIVEARAAKSVVVVDEAYIEYSDTESLASLVSRYENLVVLRTLSKALALAGVRCGAVIASAGLVRLLDSVLAPYALSSPVIAAAELALSNEQLVEAKESIGRIVAERERLRGALGDCGAVQQIWPSQANFLLVRFRDLDKVKSHLEADGIVIRTFANDPTLNDCARITVASAADNSRLLMAIRGLG